MSGAMLIATSIFFLGNNHVLPEILRQDYFLLTPIFTVVAFMLFATLQLCNFATLRFSRIKLHLKK